LRVPLPAWLFSLNASCFGSLIFTHIQNGKKTSPKATEIPI
jgi:hypothetical protein